MRPGNVSFKLSFFNPFSIINANQLRFFVVYCTSYNLIVVGQSRDYVYFAMWYLSKSVELTYKLSRQVLAGNTVGENVSKRKQVGHCSKAYKFVGVWG